MSILDLTWPPRWTAAQSSPPPQDVWHYRWAVTLTMVKPDEPTKVDEKHLVAESVDDLVDVVLHHSLDPRVAAYSYHRFTALDMTAAPTRCAECGERYQQLSPGGQAWRETCRCSCGGHAIFSCTACGTHQAYPRVEPDCGVDRASLAAPATCAPQPSRRTRRRLRAVGLRRKLLPFG